jgi:hypothetical protein
MVLINLIISLVPFVIIIQSLFQFILGRIDYGPLKAETEVHRYLFAQDGGNQSMKNLFLGTDNEQVISKIGSSMIY